MEDASTSDGLEVIRIPSFSTSGTYGTQESRGTYWTDIPPNITTGDDSKDDEVAQANADESVAASYASSNPLSPPQIVQGLLDVQLRAGLLSVAGTASSGANNHISSHKLPEQVRQEKYRADPTAFKSLTLSGKRASAFVPVVSPTSERLFTSYKGNCDVVVLNDSEFLRSHDDDRAYIFENSRSDLEQLSNAQTADDWTAKYKDHPIITDKETKSAVLPHAIPNGIPRAGAGEQTELQKLKDTLRKMVELEPRLKRELDLDDILGERNDISKDLTQVLSDFTEMPDQELLQVLSGLVEDAETNRNENRQTQVQDPDGVIIRTQQIGGKEDPEEQRTGRQGQRQEPEGTTSVLKRLMSIDTNTSLSPCRNTTHSAPSTQKEATPKSFGEGENHRDDIFRSFGSVFTTARNHEEVYEEEILFVDETEEGIICVGDDGYAREVIDVENSGIETFPNVSHDSRIPSVVFAETESTQEKTAINHELSKEAKEKRAEMEQALLQLKSKEISSSNYQKLMRGLQTIDIIDVDAVDGDDSIDPTLFQNQHVTSSQFDKIVHALAKVDIVKGIEGIENNYCGGKDVQDSDSSKVVKGVRWNQAQIAPKGPRDPPTDRSTIDSPRILNTRAPQISRPNRCRLADGNLQNKESMPQAAGRMKPKSVRQWDNASVASSSIFPSSFLSFLQQPATPSRQPRDPSVASISSRLEKTRNVFSEASTSPHLQLDTPHVLKTMAQNADVQLSQISQSLKALRSLAHHENVSLDDKSDRSSDYGSLAEGQTTELRDSDLITKQACSENEKAAAYSSSAASSSAGSSSAMSSTEKLRLEFKKMIEGDLKELTAECSSELVEKATTTIRTEQKEKPAFENNSAPGSKDCSNMILSVNRTSSGELGESTIIFDDTNDEAIPWTGADGIEIILSHATDSHLASIDEDSLDDLADFKSSNDSTNGRSEFVGAISQEKLTATTPVKRYVPKLTIDTQSVTLSGEDSSIQRPRDQLVGMVLNVQKDNPFDKKDVTPSLFDFADFPLEVKNSKYNVDSLGGDSALEGSAMICNKACSETTDSVRNIPSSSHGSPRVPTTPKKIGICKKNRIPGQFNCQSKVDIFKRRLEKFSIVGKDVVRKDAVRKDVDLMKSTAWSQSEAPQPASNLPADTAEKDGEQFSPEQVFCDSTVSHKDDETNQASSLCTADSSTLIGDKYIEDPEYIHDKMEIVKADIENVRRRLQKMAPKRLSQNMDAPKENITPKKTLLTKKSLKSAPTTATAISTPKSYSTAERIRRLEAAVGVRGSSAETTNTGTPTTNKTRVRTDAILREELDIMEVADGAERRVREDLAKMKQGLAQNKIVKMSMEQIRKKKMAAESPKSFKSKKKLGGFNSSTVAGVGKKPAAMSVFDSFIRGSLLSSWMGS